MLLLISPQNQIYVPCPYGFSDPYGASVVERNLLPTSWCIENSSLEFGGGKSSGSRSGGRKKVPKNSGEGNSSSANKIRTPKTTFLCCGHAFWIFMQF